MITDSPLVVLVDDDPLILKCLERYFDRIGFRVYAFGDSAEAIACCRHEAVDLVVTDIDMPDPDGVAVMTAVRQARPGLPVIALTGNPELLEARMRARRPDEPGFACVLGKPLALRELTDTVIRWLRPEVLDGAALTVA